MFLDLVVPDVFWLSLTAPGLLGLSCLLWLKVVSSLHGGVVVVQRPTLFHCCLLTFWLVRETEEEEEDQVTTQENQGLMDQSDI